MLIDSQDKEMEYRALVTFRQRLSIIIQLCLAFSLILWYAAQPFMGDYFQVKSRLLLYEYILGTSEILKDTNQAKLERNAARFASLAQEKQHQLIQMYQKLYDYATRPFINKIKEGFRSLLLDVPSFEQAWIFFSITIAIFILFRIEGAKQTAWLLPCIALAYGIDNHINGTPLFQGADITLFPSESTIQQHYVNEPLSLSSNIQRLQLKQGWERYLIQNWTNEKHNSQNQEQLLEEAEFNFTVARLKCLQTQPLPSRFFIFHQKSHLGFLFIYLMWNLFFAWVMHPRKIINHFEQYHAYEGVQQFDVDYQGQVTS